MPRKSAASLSVVPVIGTQTALRPRPPADLPAAAKGVWEATTGARLAAYFDAASLPLLEAYCRAVAEHRRLMTLVERMDPATDAGDYCKLARIADAHAARISQLATRMRLSQQSRTDSRGAGRAAGDHRDTAARVRANYGAPDED